MPEPGMMGPFRRIDDMPRLKTADACLTTAPAPASRAPRPRSALRARSRWVALVFLGWVVLPGAGAEAAGSGDLNVRTAKPGTTFSDCPGCPEMVVIPPGKFRMGFDGGEPERYEGPVRDVKIGYSFAAGKYEITNAQYRAFSKDTKRVSTKGCYALSGLVGTQYKPMPGKDWEDPGYGRPIRDDEPAACITWTDAHDYVTWLARKTGRKYRLLSEAEWEYVARAGQPGRFIWGDSPERACDESNLFDASGARALPGTDIGVAPCDDGFPGVSPVGRLKPNKFGLYDMIGNVWEWVEDCYTMPHTADAPVDGSPQVKNGCDRRGSRGGSWISSFDRQRPAFRGRDPVDRISQIFGFRIARD
jgi:formylglycine-generating enzyme required for sulfatase activity